MIREKSCGAVVYYEAAGERLYLLEEMRAGHYSMPKGHVEPGESEAETAEREIGEETGLAVTADTGFRACESYRPYPGCVKEVVFFTACAGQTAVAVQPEEVRSVCWLPLKAALARLSYEEDREILRKADAYLDKLPAHSE